MLNPNLINFETYRENYDELLENKEDKSNKIKICNTEHVISAIINNATA